MPFQPLMQRIIATKALKFRDGKLRIWGIPAAIYSLFSVSYITRLLEKGYKGADIFYWAGYHQSKAATHTMVKRFGYKKKVIEAVSAHSTMLGLGTVEPVVIDIRTKYFLFKRRSELAIEYLKEYGRQNKPICYFYRGQCAGLIDALFEGEEFVAVEKKCIAMGHKICEVIVMPKKKLNLSDKFVKEQIPTVLPSPFELGYKRPSPELPQRDV